MKARKFKQWEDEIMRRFYPNTLNSVLAKALNRSHKSIEARAHKLSLLKDKSFFDEHCSATRFKKGMIPANKGKKMPYNANSARTQFKKGHAPHNTVPIGAETYDKDGYLKRKVSDRKDIPARKNWVYVHRELWERHNGAIPDKHIVVFKNGDKTDIRIENLECISMKENIERNQIGYPVEILRMTQLVGALNRQIRKRDEYSKQ